MVFQVSAATIASWGRRLDEDGPNSLLGMPESVNKFPDFVRSIVQRLQTLCPHLGKVKIAQFLALAGLNLVASTVGRIRKERPADRPEPEPVPNDAAPPAERIVTATGPNHVKHVDFTFVPASGGFWVPWLPFALPLTWPFCWWAAVVVDHFSRKALGFALVKGQPGVVIDMEGDFLGGCRHLPCVTFKRAALCLSTGARCSRTPRTFTGLPHDFR
jgi:hypothetical protein